MSFHFFQHVANTLSRVTVPIGVVLTIYLYLYPVFLGCAFPSTNRSTRTAFADTLAKHVSSETDDTLQARPYLAPFRLLVLADPQLEGDTSLPDPEDALPSRLSSHWARLLNTTSDVFEISSVGPEILKELALKDIPGAFKAARKRLDLFGNDYYLAHIFRTMHWWTKPTHVTVLGDLIGSQWTDDEEFEWRGWRFWNRVFRGGRRVEDQIMESTTQNSRSVMRMDDSDWQTRIINIAGNHDIGYAGDISQGRMVRFESKYGKANWDVRFSYPTGWTNGSDIQPTLHLVVLNSMLLDTPARDEALQGETYGYLNDVITHRTQPVEDKHDFTLLLTHVPLHKKEGICVDAPFFDFWGDEEDCNGKCKPNSLKEQNHLSDHASGPGLLQALFGTSGDLDAAANGQGRPGLVLTGHDHEGCDVWHYIPQNTTYKSSQPTEGGDQKTHWDATRWADADMTMAHTGLREVTLRSMMGEFGGNAGLLSMWFDFDEGRWQYDIQMCKLGVQHIWWAIHIIDLIAITTFLLSTLLAVAGPSVHPIKRKPGDKSMKIE